MESRTFCLYYYNVMRQGKYHLLNKMFFIEGKVIKVNNQIYDPHLVMEGFNKVENVKCEFVFIKKKELDNISVGQTIILAGWVNFKDGRLVLENSSLNYHKIFAKN